MLDFAYAAFRRRAIELAKAADAEIDKASSGILLFYAVECGLKAIYMSRNSLRKSGDTNAVAIKAANEFGHKLDRLIKALNIAPATLAHTPGTITLRSGEVLAVHEIHSAWRYGGAIVEHEDIITWLKRALKYATEELR